MSKPAGFQISGVDYSLLGDASHKTVDFNTKIATFNGIFLTFPLHAAGFQLPVGQLRCSIRRMNVLSLPICVRSVGYSGTGGWSQTDVQHSNRWRRATPDLTRPSGDEALPL